MSGNKRTKYGGWDDWYGYGSDYESREQQRMRLMGEQIARQNRSIASRQTALRALQSSVLPPELQRHVFSYIRPQRYGPLLQNGQYYKKKYSYY